MVDNKIAPELGTVACLFFGALLTIFSDERVLAAGTPACKAPSVTKETMLCSHGLSGHVEKRVLINALLDACGVSNNDIAADGNISYSKQVLAIQNFATFCSAPGNCSADVRIKLGQVLGDLRSFSAGRPILVGTNKVRISYASSVDAFLQTSPDATDATCVPLNEGGTTKPPPEQPSPSASGGSFAIRKNITDLPVGRDDPNFKGLAKASAAVNDDYVNTNLGVNVDVAVGYNFTPVGLGGSSQVTWTPFVYYHEQYVASKKVSQDQQIYNVAGGLLSTWELTNLGIFQIAPKYVQAIKANADIGSANLYYTPPITVAGIGTAVQVPLTGGWIYYRFAPQLQVTYGDVGRASTTISQLPAGWFGWIGSNLSLYLYGAGPLEGFSYISSFVYLDTFAGRLSHVTRYENSLSYALTGDDTWSLQLKYVYGPDLDTLQWQKMLTLGLGLKY
jgi:hypothetical protein